MFRFNIYAFLFRLLCFFSIYSVNLFASCSVFTWEELTLSSSILDDQTYFSDEFISISFSLALDSKSVERIIQLQTNSAQSEPSFSWKSNTLNIKPKHGWQKGEFYQIRMQGDVQTRDNRMYPVYFQRNFMFGSEENIFKLIQNTPSNSQSILKNQPLVLSFNKAVSITSFENVFSLSPATDITINYLEDARVISVAPKNGWQVNTLYFWSVDKAISSDGYLLNKDYSDSFYAPSDLILPQLLSVHPIIPTARGLNWRTDVSLDGHVRETLPIGFIFNKPMDIESLRSGISFEPNIKGYFDFDEEKEYRYIFYPEEAYSLDTRYELRFAPSISDVSGLQLFDEHLIYFSSAQDYLQVLSVDFDTTQVADSFPQKEITYELQQTEQGVFMDVHIHFSTSISNNYKKIAVEAVSVHPFFPSTIHSPSLQSVSWNNAGNTLSMRWSNFSKSTQYINQYKILIRGGENGVINESGEYLKEDVWLIFTAL